MSLDKKQRNELPDDDYAGPHETFYIRNQKDVEDAKHLIGKAADPEAVKSRIISIAKRKGLTIPDEWKSKAEFGEGRVTKRGRVFQFGTHVDKNGSPFSLAEDEFLKANPPGKKVPLGLNPMDLGHYWGEKNALDGRLGVAFGFDTSKGDIQADFEMSQLLLDIVKDEKLRMSAVFHPVTKELMQIDFVKKPMLADAVLFGEGDPPQTVTVFASDEDMALFGLDIGPDNLRRVQAVDGVESPLALLAATHQKSMQGIHDVCCSAYPGLCNPNAAFGMNEGPRKHMGIIHKMTLTHGATCKPTAQFSQGSPTVADNELDPVAIELASIREQLRVERSKRIASEVAMFSQSNAAVLTPAARPFFEALYIDLASMDSADSQVVMFGEGTKLTRLEALRKGIASLTPHGHGAEKVIEHTKDEPLPLPTGKEVVGGVRIFGGGGDVDNVASAAKSVESGVIPAARMERLKAAVGSLPSGRCADVTSGETKLLSIN